MKMLAALTAVQIILIALLYLKLDAVDQQLGELAETSPPAAEISTPQPAEGRDPEPAVTRQGIGAAELRRVVREELQAVMKDRAAQQGAEPAAPLEFDEAEMQSRQEQILREMAYFKSLDEVSSAELDLLLAEIAKLDPERRSEMMNELNRAMNGGEIRGTL